MSRETITIRFEVNRADLNRRLGNTSDVPLDRAMTELLGDVFAVQMHPQADWPEPEDEAIDASFNIIEGN